MQTRLSRAEVPAEQTWNLNDLFGSDAAWEAEFAAVDATRNGVVTYQSRLGEGGTTLLACLNAVEELEVRFARVSTFARVLLPRI